MKEFEFYVKKQKIYQTNSSDSGFLLIIFTWYGISDKNPETVNIGYLPTDHDAALFVANATGMFKKAGLEVELFE